MNHYFLSLSAALVGMTLAGCANNHERIDFLSEPKALRYPVAPDPKISPSLSAAEEMQVEEQVFTRLLQGHFGEDGHYTAIFLQASESQTASLMKQFPNHNPPIKQLWHADSRPGFTPLDKDTGRPAMIFSVEEMDPENDRVIVIGRWYAGEAVKGFYNYTLIKTAEGWVIPASE